MDGWGMEEKLHSIYKRLVDISAAYLIYQDRHNIELIKDQLPQIQEFVLWFMESNRLEIEASLYADMCSNLIFILKDILTALEQGDRVLMHDAVANGIMEYLDFFIEPKEKSGYE
jgi:hypothetical protein